MRIDVGLSCTFSIQASINNVHLTTIKWMLEHRGCQDTVAELAAVTRFVGTEPDCGINRTIPGEHREDHWNRKESIWSMASNILVNS